MDALLGLGGVWLARVYVVYGVVFLVLPAVLFAYLPLLAAVIWGATSHSRGGQPWQSVPPVVRRRVRLAVEIAFGLLNPVLYLAVLLPSIADLRFRTEWMQAPATTSAWILLGAFWSLRFFGAALDLRSRLVRATVRALLIAAIACVVGFTFKDASPHFAEHWGQSSRLTFVLSVLRLCPLYLIPLVLLCDYLQSVSSRHTSHSLPNFFLLPDRACRVAVAGVICLAVVTLGVTAQRRSDGSARRLVGDHFTHIRAAAAAYDVDPRLIASIVYVTHRDQLSPFRDALERVIVSAWADNLRRRFNVNPPDNVRELGTDESPFLNRALDISVGLAQIKPRTALIASVLATGRTPDELPAPAVYAYRDLEPIGEQWAGPPGTRSLLSSPIPVPAERQIVAGALLDSRSNLATCALILALYQNQWEIANTDWSIRRRPDILATLYQIGFARSKPHPQPRSNAFGRRVQEVYEQSWLGQLLETEVRAVARQ